MSLPFLFTRTAQNDLAELSAYLTLTFGEEKAQDSLKEIFEKIKLLGDFPSLGVPLPESYGLKVNCRFLTLRDNIVFYLVGKEEVEILVLVSSKERFRSLFSSK